jgi:integrase
MITSHKNRRDGTVAWRIRYEVPIAWNAEGKPTEYRKKQETVRPVLDASGTIAQRPTKQDAANLLTRRKAEILAGTWVDPDAPPVPAPEPDRGPMFEGFAKDFLERHPGKRRSEHYPKNVAALVAHFGPRYLREISRSDLDSYRVLLETTARQGRRLSRREQAANPGGPTHRTLPPLSSTSVLIRLRVLHRVLKCAVRWGVLAVNVAADLEKPAPRAGRLRWLSKDEYDRLEAASPPWVRPMMLLAVASGMRLKEVATLRWEGVDFAARTIHVEQDTKTGPREIPMSEAARLILVKQDERRKKLAAERAAAAADWKPSLLVFTDDTGAGHDDEHSRRKISEAVRFAAVRCGLGNGVGFHVLRHTAGSRMAQAGVPLYQVQRVLGHSTPVMTQRYAHLAPDHLKSAVAALDAAMGVVSSGHLSDTSRDEVKVAS